MSIYVYSGLGTDNLCAGSAYQSLKDYLGREGYPKLIHINDPSYITSREWFKNANAFVVPGGSAFGLYENLQEGGCKKIKQFVDQGGSYLGICAGVYLASPYAFRFNKESDPYEGIARIPLIEETLQGPTYSQFDANGMQTSFGNSTAKLVPVTVTSSDKEFYTFWNGGGYYSQLNSSQRAIALYGDDPQKIAAMVQTNPQGGTVVVSNVHPEIRLEEPSEFQPFPFDEEQIKAYSLRDQEALFTELCMAANIK